MSNDINNINGELSPIGSSSAISVANKAQQRNESETVIGDSIDRANVLNKSTGTSHLEKILTKTYFFSKNDAENIQAFIDALGESIDEQIEKFKFSDSIDCNLSNQDLELKREKIASERLKENITKGGNITAGFFTKLKSLCAKIASFFGDNTKTEKLQNEGILQFKELRDHLMQGVVGRNFLVSFIEANSDNEKVMAGMFKVLFGIEYGDAQKNVLNNILKENSNDKMKLLNFMIELNSKENQLDKAKFIKDTVFSTIGELTIDEDVTEKLRLISSIADISNDCLFIKKMDNTNEQDYYTGRIIVELNTRYKDMLNNFANHENTNYREEIINEFNDRKSNHNIEFALFDKISPEQYGDKMSTITVEQFVNAAKESLGGDEKFLSTFESEILNGSLGIKDKKLLLNEAFVKSIIDSNNKQKVEGYAKACYWADKQLVEQALSASLKEKIPVSENQEKVFDNCALFNDVARNYSCSFTVGSKNFTISANTQKEGCVKIIENAISDSLSDTEVKALIGFCNNFPSQGVFAIPYPGFSDVIPMGAEGEVGFSVKINDNGDTHVKAAASGKCISGSGLTNDAKICQPEDLKMSIYAESTLSFTYKGGIVASKGIADDIHVQKYTQNITFE